MADIVSPTVRSHMMSGIRYKNTKPEVIIRRNLHANGFRYLLHDKRLPGKPDLVFPKYRAVIMVNGCFWHGHDCHLFRWPSTRSNFWKSKIRRNREKDRENLEALSSSGWRILTIWECSLKGKGKLPIETLTGKTMEWLRSSNSEKVIRGTKD